MRRFIEDLRERPREDRQRFAFASSAAVTVVLLLGWGVSTIGFSGHASPTAETAAAASGMPGQELGQQISAGYQHAADSLASFVSELRAIQQQSAAMQQETSPQETGAVVTIPASQ
ncbi:MAG TPA: hypothetical protein VFL98_02375 [Candidatus Paceibacterota bacterium]|nr:hypothetical protein [Candidatus Paceibacterota bacterium]